MWGRLQWLQLGSGKGDKCLKAGRPQTRLRQHGGMWDSPVPELEAAAWRGRASALQAGPLGH